jgi:TRAP-type uncharacterized transport system fused permease subunit
MNIERWNTNMKKLQMYKFIFVFIPITLMILYLINKNDPLFIASMVSFILYIILVSILELINRLKKNNSDKNMIKSRIQDL